MADPSNLSHHATSRHSSTRPASALRTPSVDHLTPAGPCNYRDMRHGRHASNCGCQRYWPDEDGHYNKLPGSSGGGAWCFCGHHACYHKLDAGQFCDQDVTMGGIQDRAQEDCHEDVYTSMSSDNHQAMPPPSARPSCAATPRLSLDLQSSQISRKSLGSRHQGKTIGTPRRTFREHSHLRSPQPSHPTRTSMNVSAPTPSGLGLYLQQAERFASRNAANASVARVPSTRSESRATEVATDQEDNTSFPNPSSVQPTPISHLSALQFRKPVGQTMHEDQATEVDTPSIAGTPAFGGAEDAEHALEYQALDLHHPPNPMQYVSDQHQPRRGTINSSMQAQSLERRNDDRHGADPDTQDVMDFAIEHPGLIELIDSVAFTRKQLAQLPSLTASVEGLSSRMNRLEDVSFSNDLNENVSDKLEFFEGRLIDLEGKVDDFERSHLESRSSDKACPDFSRLSRLAAGASVLTSSDASSFRDATIERLKGLEERLDVMRGPTPSQPRQVEVVFLPWGKGLKGLWFDAMSSQISIRDGEGSGQSGSTSRSSQRSTSGRTDQSVNAEQEDEWSKYTDGWLSPRACGPTSGAGGRVFERLKSRGLVRNVLFRASSARHVHTSICATFQDMPPSSNPSSSNTMSSGLQGRHNGPLFGLQSPFVPLRKLHKSSRLRFLSASELTTPSLWTMSFLESSVFMQAPSAGITRLYITTPLAYLQREKDPGWTWQRLRELPRVSEHDLPAAEKLQPTTSFGSNGVDEADARESCWELHDKLDPPPSVHSSFASNDSFQRHQQEKDSFASSHPLTPRQTEHGSQGKGQSAEDSSANFSTSASGSDASYDGQEGELSSARFAPITPLSELPPSSRHSLAGRRTASFPVNVVHSSNDLLSYEQKSAEAAKRNVTSFDAAAAARQEPARITNIVPSSLSKRRRLSRSSDETGVQAVRAGPWALTPRRSREPSSPAGSGNSDPQLMLGNVDGFGAGALVGQNMQNQTITGISHKADNKDRASAYATPHSWSGSRAGRTAHSGFGNAGDTDVDMSSDDAVHDPHFEGEGDEPEIDEIEVERAVVMDEEAWEGVGGGAESDSDDDDEDEDNADDGDHDHGMGEGPASRHVGCHAREDNYGYGEEDDEEE